MKKLLYTLFLFLAFAIQAPLGGMEPQAPTTGKQQDSYTQTETEENQPEGEPQEKIDQDDTAALLERYNARLSTLVAEKYNDIVFEGRRLSMIGPNLNPTIVWDIDDTLLLSSNAESFLTKRPEEQINPYDLTRIEQSFWLYQELKKTRLFTFFFLSSRTDGVVGTDADGHEVSARQATLDNLTRCGYIQPGEISLDQIIFLPTERIQQVPEHKIFQIAVDWKQEQLLALKAKGFSLVAFLDDHDEYFYGQERAFPITEFVKIPRLEEFVENPAPPLTPRAFRTPTTQSMRPHATTQQSGTSTE